MRKLMWAFVCTVVCSPVAGAWGLLPQCVKNSSAPCFADSFLLAGQTAVVNLEIMQDNIKSSEAKVISGFFERGFDSWINAVRNEIAKAHREAEFSEFLALFPKNVQVRPVISSSRGQSKNSAQGMSLGVGFNLPALKTAGTADACASADPVSHLVDWKTFYTEYASKNSSCSFKTMVITHELGHLLGLIDLYDNKLNQAQQRSRLIQDFSLLKWNGKISTQEMEQHSMMGKDSGQNIGCDDVDGLINMADIIAAKKGKTFKHTAAGWESFCESYRKKGVKYAYGQPYLTDEEKQENRRRLHSLASLERDGAAETKKLDKAIGVYSQEIKKINTVVLKNCANAAQRQSVDCLLLETKKGYLVSKQNALYNLKDGWGGQSHNKSLEELYQTAAAGKAQYSHLLGDNPSVFNQEELNNFALRGQPSYRELTERRAKQREEETKRRVKRETAALQNFALSAEEQALAEKEQKAFEADFQKLNLSRPVRMSTDKPAARGAVSASSAAQVSAGNKTARVSKQPNGVQSTTANYKQALDQYIARHPNLQSSLAAVKSGRPTAAQQREVSEYMRLFEEYKNSRRVTVPSGGR